MTKTVLMLCYFFPPLGGAGVQRSLQLAKYLPDHEWNPVVISVAPNRRNSIEQGRDDASVSEIDPRTVVYRARSRERASLYSFAHRMRIRKLLFEAERLVPNMHQDYKRGWQRPALDIALQLLPSLDGPTVVYSSAPPYSAHRVGLRLRAAAGVPWVADYRDPLTLRASYRPGSRIQRWIDTRLDQSVAVEADAIIANTETDRLRFVDRFSGSNDRVHVVPNGFDPDDFAPGASHDLRSATGKFLVTCVGKFYDLNDPGLFFRAFREFSLTHADASLHFLAPLSRATRRAADSELEGVDWSVTDRLPHAEAVQEMERSAVLLVNQSEGWTHHVPGKLYEYLAARRPVLFIGPGDSDAAKLIRRARVGQVAGFDETSIVRSLEAIYAEYQDAPRKVHSDESVISQFDRREQAKHLAAIFDSVAMARPR